MSITYIGFLLIPLAIFCGIKCDLKQLLFITFIFSTFTTTSILNLDVIGFSLTVGHFFGMVLLVKTALYLIQRKIDYQVKFNFSIIFFMIYAAISLVYPLLFSKGVEVLTPDDNYMPITFKFQMITQYAYLVFGFLMLVVTVLIINRYSLEKEDMLKVSRAILIIFIGLMILQYIIPVNLYNSIFRAAHMSNDQTMNGVIRLSGPTIEASILSFTCLPFIIPLILNLTKKTYKLDVILCLVTAGLIATTKSSTFIVSIAFISLITLIYWGPKLYEQFNIRQNKGLLFISIGCLLAIFLVGAILFKDIFLILVDKLMAKNTSGSLRTRALSHHLKVFMHYPLTGVGFGTIRSYDLFTTWLASLGLVGFGSFIFYIFTLFKKLLWNKDCWIYLTMVALFLINMLISIPEPYYLYFWMCLGLLQYFYMSDQKDKMNKSI